MSTKINVWHIVIGHLKTLSDYASLSSMFWDLFTFFLIPLVFSSACYYLNLNASKDLISLAVNFGAIFTALLLSVLVLVYDQENKLRDKINQVQTSGADPSFTDPNINVKIKLMEQLYYNIAYCIILSILLIAISFLALCAKDINHFYLPSMLSGHNLINKIATPCVIFIATHLLITIMMIVKRLHCLLMAQHHA